MCGIDVMVALFPVGAMFADHRIAEVPSQLSVPILAISKSRGQLPSIPTTPLSARARLYESADSSNPTIL